MKEIKYINGKPAYDCKSWKDLDEALGKCSVPVILCVSSGSKGLTLITVADDLVLDPEKYDWSDVPIECEQCGWKGLVKDLIHDNIYPDKGKCPKCYEELLKIC